MNQPLPDDPFFGPEGPRTVFPMPMPGQRGVRPTALRSDGLDDGADALAAAGTVGLNPLVAAAHPLLMLAQRIRATAKLADPAALKESLAQGLREFESRAIGRGIPRERVLAARYVLCTVLDEAAGSTPWGASGAWASSNLLVSFHNANAGGVRVFELMVSLSERPAENRDLLELIYAALCLGFEGRFAGEPGGRTQVDAARRRLAGILQDVRGEPAPELAQRWHGSPARRQPLLSWLPLWVTGALTALALVAVYIGLSSSLGARSDPVFERILALWPAGAAPVAAAAPAPAPVRLSGLLQPEIRDGRLSVRDELDRSIVTLRGDGMFEPGSAQLSAERAQLVRRVAQALQQVAGDVTVTGHTDSTPMRSLRYPSNFELSQDRAGAVRALLVAEGLPPQRVRAEGRAAANPLVPNDTAEHRAANRRIEVVVGVAPATVARNEAGT